MAENEKRSSHIPGFYKLSLKERLRRIEHFCGDKSLSSSDLDAISNAGALSDKLLDSFTENAVGTFSLPMGIATNFLINGKDYLIPMAVEESSVVAAASHGAKIAREGGGFEASSSEPVMTGQIQVFLKDGLINRQEIDSILKREKEKILCVANNAHKEIVRFGGGARDLSWRFIPELSQLIVCIDVDTRDAMGANIVNTMCEAVAPLFPADFFSCEVGIKILTNLCDKRTAKAKCRIPANSFSTGGFDGADIIKRIEQAYLFAVHDIYRASTHNKGVMNGIDAVVIATGNDWRAVEAGAHAFAARGGRYLPMTRWRVYASGGSLFLEGEIELPMALGTVGGLTKLHPTANAALKILGNPGARELAEITCCVGLAQNLSALRALAAEGIQKGHMALHQKNLDLLQEKGNR